MRSKPVHGTNSRHVRWRLRHIEPPEARWVLEDYLASELAPEIALSRLALAVGEIAEVEALVDAVERAWEPPVPPALRRLIKILRQHRRGLERVAANLREHPNPERPFRSPDEGIAAARRFFDRAVRRNAEASVAAHSLGDPGLLAKATREVADAFARWGLLGRDRRALEIGCGIGRFQAALAPHVAAVHGIDVSPAMLAAARHRCAGVGNAVFALSAGRDLALYRDRSFHLVFAVDSFPYIHHAGAELVEAHFREAVRVLLPGGELGIFNYSYRDDPEADRCEFQRLCRAHGLAIVAAGEQPFRLWDGVAFRARRR